MTKAPIAGDARLWSVDRSFGQYRGNSEGHLALSDETKLHIDRGDTTAKCSWRVFLNSMPGDRPAGRVSEMADDPEFARMVCRRCVPESHVSGATE